MQARAKLLMILSGMTIIQLIENLFIGTPGLLIEPYHRTCCLSILKLFLTDQLTESIVDSTNKHIQLIKQVPPIKIKMINNPRSIYNLWNDVNVDGIWCYFVESWISFLDLLLFPDIVWADGINKCGWCLAGVRGC